MLPIKYTLKNGITLNFIQTDKFKTDTLSLSVKLPYSKSDYVTTALFAKLLERGSHLYPSSGELYGALDSLYGATLCISGGASAGDCIPVCIDTSCLASKYILDGTDTLGETLKIIADLWLHPAFAEDGFNHDYFTHECKIYQSKLNSIKQDPQIYAKHLCNLLLHQNDGKGLSLDEGEKLLAAITLDDIRELHSRLLEYPLSVFYVGSLDAKCLIEKLEAAFTQLPVPSKKRFSPSASPVPHINYSEAHEKFAFSQSHLHLSFNFEPRHVLAPNDTTYITAIMLSEIFGATSTSKLFMSLREKKALCYSCDSYYGLLGGSITVRCAVNAQDVHEAKSAIFHELEQIKKGNISDAELLAARKSILSIYRETYDSPFDMISFFEWRAALGIELDIDATLDLLLAVTREQITALAGSLSLSALAFVEGTGVQEQEEQHDK